MTLATSPFPTSLFSPHWKARKYLKINLIFISKKKEKTLFTHKYFLIHFSNVSKEVTKKYGCFFFSLSLSLWREGSRANKKRAKEQGRGQIIPTKKWSIFLPRPRIINRRRKTKSLESKKKMWVRLNAPTDEPWTWYPSLSLVGFVWTSRAEQHCSGTILKRKRANSEQIVIRTVDERNEVTICGQKMRLLVANGCEETEARKVQGSNFEVVCL